MPPKTSQNQGQKRKAVVEPKSCDDVITKTVNSSPSKPKKSKTCASQTTHALPGSETVRIAVDYEGSLISPLTKGQYSHTLKLKAENAFKLVTTYVATAGEHVGKQVIVLEPAKAFNFLGLPEAARKRVYDFYFANKNLVDEPIAFEGKRKDTADMYAKTYANGNRYRVGLLVVNKFIHNDALPVLYNKPFRLENSAAVLSFLAVIDDTLKPRLRHMRIATWTKTGCTSKQAMSFLVGANSIEILWIGAGIAIENEPAKAARLFWMDIGKFLASLGSAIHGTVDKDTMQMRDKTSAVDVLRFGKQALLTKDGTPYTKEQVQTFRNELRKRLEAFRPAWACICSSDVPGHCCQEELDHRLEAQRRLDSWLDVLKGGEAALALVVPPA